MGDAIRRIKPDQQPRDPQAQLRTAPASLKMNSMGKQPRIVHETTGTKVICGTIVRIHSIFNEPRSYLQKFVQISVRALMYSVRCTLGYS